MSEILEKRIGTVKGLFLDKLKNAFGGDLHAVILYGSAVKGTYMPKLSDINILIILKEAKPSNLAVFGKLCGKLIGRLRLTPLILTEEGFLNSADIFPMEYMDIRDKHVLVFGEDICARLAIDRKNLRHQLEETLRGSITKLRQGLVASRGGKRTITRILRTWYGTQNALFRGLLRLLNEGGIPDTPEAMIKAVGESYHVEPAPLNSLHAFMRGETVDPLALIGGILTLLFELVRTVDKMDIGQ